jgi:hypothetical protein
VTVALYCVVGLYLAIGTLLAATLKTAHERGKTVRVGEGVYRLRDRTLWEMQWLLLLLWAPALLGLLDWLPPTRWLEERER